MFNLQISLENEVYGSYNSIVEDMSAMPNSNDFLAERATNHLDRLLDEVLTNLDPSSIRPFTDAPPTQPQETIVPSSSSHSNSPFGQNLFQRNVIQIAPISSVMSDVEMNGIM